MRDLQVQLDKIQDPAARDAVDQLVQQLAAFPLGGFKGRWITITCVGAVTNRKIPHGLGFMPKDVILTSLIGAGALTWNYARFDRTNLDITTTGAAVIRAFVGIYEER